MAMHTAWQIRFVAASSALAVAGSTGLTGCSGGGTAEIEEVREVQLAPEAAGASSAERFGYAQGHGPGDGHDHSGDPHAGMATDAAPASGGPDFVWELPAGWEEVTPTSMRQANFRVAGDPQAECYLTVLPGGAGGVEANVNRWRGQLGLDPLTADDIAALPRRILLGGEAVLVDMRGDYKGMGSVAKPDYRMAGLILEAPRATVFLKMVGPAAIIDNEMERFEALGASIDIAAAGDSSSPNSAQGIAWDTPDGWVRGRDRTMRLVTFSPEGAPDAECYVTILPGDAGGVSANLNRWRSQMGQADLGPEEIANLQRLSVLGQEAVLVEIQGNFTGMSGQTVADAGFLGVICSAGSGTLFVKMTGPAGVVAAERDHFLAFCESLRFEG